MMKRLLVAAALLSLSAIPPSTPAIAKGPPPPPEAVDCQLDISGRMQCAYLTLGECRTALRSMKRTYHRNVFGCYQSTADPEWWHYGLYVLEFWPNT